MTAAAGRNRAFGERVGRGRPAREVAAEMLAAGELTEGYPAIAAAWRFARERGVTRCPCSRRSTPIVWEGAEVSATLKRYADDWAAADFAAGGDFDGSLKTPPSWLAAMRWRTIS